MSDESVSPGVMIRALRTRLNLRQADLAEKLEVPQSKVSYLESGGAPISAAMAIALEGVSGIPARDWLYAQADEQLRRAREWAQ